MPKPKKDKFIDFENGEFRITTTVFGSGISKDRVLHGLPTISIHERRKYIQIGCIRLSVKAFLELYVHLANGKTGTIQEGNY